MMNHRIGSTFLLYSASTKQSIKIKIKKHFLGILLFFLMTAALFLSRSFADETHKEGLAFKVSNQISTDDKAERDKLVSIVEKLTDIATKNRLNADFVPGMVTVLYGKDLEALGVQKVWDALALVPGIDLSLERQGFFQTFVRGSGTVFAPISMKILIDGIPLTTVIGLTSVVKMPVEQIDRIEIIRGPGSAVHGEFALLGVVNIITRKQINQISSSFGSYDTYGSSGIFSLSDPNRDFNINLNLAGWKTDGAKINTGPDTLHGMGMKTISYAPGPTNEKADYGSGFLNFTYDDFSFRIFLMDSGQGDFFGIGYALPPPEKHKIFQEQQWGLTATQKLDLSSTLHFNFTIGWQEQKFECNEGYFYPPGFSVMDPNGFVLEYPDGWIYGFQYKERWFHTGIDLSWKVWEKHTLLLGWSFSRADFIDAWLETNVKVSPSTPFPLPSNQAIKEYADEKYREINSVTLQDEFRLSSQFTITAGLRYDHYNDIGYRVSPRMAAVYKLTRRHILKTQYAQAFRPPTFFEMYAPTNPIILSNSELKPEIVNTFEFGYIYKGIQTVGRITSFYSEFKKRIFEDNSLHIYRNTEEVDYYSGMEVELEREIGSVFKFDTNLSYIDSKNRNVAQYVPQTAKWLFNLGIRSRPKNNLTLTAQYRYVGERNREPLDLRGPLRGYQTVDLTGTIFDLGLKGITLRAGIKNLFDEDIRYPAPLERYWPLSDPYPTYPEDFPRPGRRWWMQLTYTF